MLTLSTLLIKNSTSLLKTHTSHSSTDRGFPKCSENPTTNPAVINKARRRSTANVRRVHVPQVRDGFREARRTRHKATRDLTAAATQALPAPQLPANFSTSSVSPSARRRRRQHRQRHASDQLNVTAVNTAVNIHM